MNKPLTYVKRHFETFLYVPGRRAMLNAEQRAKRFFRGRLAAILLCALAFLAQHPAKAESDLPVPDGWSKDWADGATEINLSHASRNWSDFSIGEGFTVNFTGSGTAVNKVTGGVRSDIFGTLTGDRVYILNPNGILFGSSARVDVNGLVAAAVGALEDGPDGMVFSKLGSGSVVNRGTINAGKFAYLVGKSVENAGSIRAGEVALAAFGGTGAQSLTIASAPNGATITFDIPGDPAAEEGGDAGEGEGGDVVSSGTISGVQNEQAQGGVVLRSSPEPEIDADNNISFSGTNVRIDTSLPGKNITIAATGGSVEIGNAGNGVSLSASETIVVTADRYINVKSDAELVAGQDVTMTAGGNINMAGTITATAGSVSLGATGAGKSVKIGYDGGDSADQSSYNASASVSAGGDIALSGDKSAQLLAGSIQSTGGTVSMEGKEYVAVNGDVTGKNVELKTTEAKTLSEAVGGYDAGSPAGVLQRSGTITALDGNVTIDSAGSVALQGTAVSAADNTVSITAGDTDAGQIVRDAGITAKTVSMKAKSVTGTGALSTDELGFEGESFSDDSLSVSKIAIRATGEGGNITVANDKALTVGEVDGITGLATASGGNISITADGAITVSEAVNANRGNVTLDAGANSISILADTSGGSVTLKSDATVGSDTKTPKLAATAAGGVIDASEKTLTLKKGEISGDEIKAATLDVDGGTVSAGSITATTAVEQTDGEITAATIAGDVSVSGENSSLVVGTIDGDLVQEGGAIRGLGAIIDDTPGDPEPPTIEITGTVTQSGGTLGGVGAEADVEVATDNVTIGGALTQNGDDARIVADTLTLKGGATQTKGAVEASTLTLDSSDADVTLDQANNRIGTVGGSAKNLALVDSEGGLVLAEIGAAKLTLETAGAMTQVEGKTVTATADDIVLTADTIETTGAISATAGDVRLLAGNGATIGGTVAASSGNIRIDAGEGALAVGAAVDGQNVTLFAEGDVTEGAAVSATADKLVESASGNIVVDTAGTIGGKGAYLAESGSVTVADGKTLEADDFLYVKANSVSGVVAASDLVVETGSGNSVRAAGGSISFGAGQTTVAGASKVAAKTADDLVVDSGTSALEVGAFDSASADIAIAEVVPDKTSDHPAGTVDRTLVASGEGGIEGIEAKSVRIDAGNVTVGKSVTATDGNISISGTGITVNDALEAAGNTVELDAGTGNVEIAANVTAETLELKSATEIKSGTTGVTTLDATGKTLTVSGTGDIDVGETLTAATLDVDAGTVDAKNVQAAVDQDGGQITVAETIAGAVGQKGATEAVTLSAKKIDGTLTQEEGNAGVVTVGNVTGATVQNGGKILKHADAEQLKFDSTVTQNGGTIASEADNVHIFDKFTQSGGTLNASQLQFSRNAEQTAAAGTVNAAAILLPGGGSDVTLDKGGNKIGKLSGTVRNLAIRDTDGGLVVGNDGGKVEARGTVTLEATAGDITQEANLVASGLTTLTAKNVNLANSEWNSFNGGVAATATADNGDVRIVHRNIGVAENLDVQGVEAGSDGKRGDILVKSINDGGIAVNGVVNGNNVTLKADKNISESAAVNADADKYVVSDNGNITVTTPGTVKGNAAYVASNGAINGGEVAASGFVYLNGRNEGTATAKSTNGGKVFVKSGDNQYESAGGEISYDADGNVVFTDADTVAFSGAGKNVIVQSTTKGVNIGTVGSSGDAALRITEVLETTSPATQMNTLEGTGGGDAGATGLEANKVTIDVAGNVTQDEGAAVVAHGDASITATGHDIKLAEDNTANDFQGNVTANGASVTLKDKDAITLGKVEATGGAADIEAITGKATVNGAVTATTEARVKATAGEIEVAATGSAAGDTKTTLDGNAGVTGAGAVGKAGSQVDVDAANGQINLTGVVLGADADFTAKDAVSVANENNDFTGTVTAKGTGVTLKDGNGGIKLGAVTATGGNVTVDALNGGNIDVNAGATVKSETGDVTLTANGGISTISGTMDAKKNAKVVSENGSIVLADGSKVTADTKVVLNGKTGVTGGGTVDATGAELDVNAAGGNVNLTGKVLAKSATFDAKDVSVYGANNDFTGDVSAKATAGSIAIRDANAITLKSADATQDARVVAGGTLDVAGAVKGGGNVLLQSTGADVNVEAAVGGEDRKPKNVTINAAGTATLKADVTAKEDILVEGTKGVSSEVVLKAGKPGGTIAFIATEGAVSVNKGKLESGVLYSKDRNGSDFGTTKVGAGAIYVDTGDTIRMLNIDDENATVAFTAKNDVILKSTGNLTVGLSSGGSGKSANVTEVLADVQKGTKERNLSTESTGGGLSGITAGNDVDIESKSISGSSIKATRGDVDIKTIGGNYSVSETKSGGNTTLDVAGSVGKVDSIEAGKDLDLDASGSLDASTVKAGGTADIVTGGDAIVSTLDAGEIVADIGGNLESDQIVNARGDANLVVQGGVTAEEIVANGAIVLESGDLSFTTMTAKSIEATTGSIEMGKVSATDAAFDAKGSISDNESEVAVKTLTMKASGDIGSSSAPIVTKTSTLKDISGKNVYLKETTSGDVGIGTIEAKGDLEFTAPNIDKDHGLVKAGDGLLKAGGDMTLDVAGHVGRVSTAKDNHITIDVGGKLSLKSGSLSGYGSKGEKDGMIVLGQDQEGYVYVIVDMNDKDIFEKWNGFSGADGQKIPGLVIVNGQVLEGNPDLIRAIHRAEAFTIETPELKSKQGVFGSPVFIHTDMDVSEAASIGSVDYLQMEPFSMSPLQEGLVRQWLRDKGLIELFKARTDNPMGLDRLYTKDYTDFESRKPAEKEPEAKPDRSEKEKAKKEAKLREKADAAAQDAANREARDASPDVSSSASGPASSPGA